MNSNICLNCGSPLEHPGVPCALCGFPGAAVSPKLQKPLTEAYALLNEARFDEAKKAFEAILYNHPKTAEAYFGRLRARYHIRYTQNEEGKLVPICPTSSGKNIEDDVDYRQVMEYASEEQRTFLQALAAAIKNIYSQNQPSKNYANKFTLGAVDPNDTAPKKSKLPLILSVSSSFVLVLAIAIGFATGVLHIHQAPAATCTEARICTICNKQVAPAKGHKPGAQATCTEAQNCKVCNAMLMTALGHEPEWVTVTPATKTEDGLQEAKCLRCALIFDQDVLYATGSIGLAFSEKSDGTCRVSGIGSCTDTEIVIPAMYNNKPVTYISADAFRGCKGLTSIVILEGITTIESAAFYGCDNLKSISIPESVTSIASEALRGCGSLMSLSIPDSITNIGDSAFRGCNSLKSISVPDSVMSIGEFAFYGCNSLTSITLPFVGNNRNGTGKTHFGYIFGASTYSQHTTYIPTSLKTVIITDSTVIADNAFSDCVNLVTITLPESVMSIGSPAFYGCSSLTEISVHENNAYYCSENGILFNKAKTELISYPAGKTETSYSIPDSITNIGEYMFYGCSSLTSIVIPNTIKNIGSYAFYGCTGLTSLQIPEGVIGIGSFAFSGCTGLQSLVIPESVTSIGDRAFLDCKSLTEMVIPKSVSSMNNSVFYGCTALTSLVIPESVTNIGYYALADCHNLKNITFGGTTAQWSSITFGVAWNQNTGDYTVTCTDGTVSKN